MVNFRTILELIVIFVLMAAIGYLLSSNPAQAQGYGNDYGYGERGGRRGDPQHWSDVGNPPQFTTYPDSGYSRRGYQGYDRGSDPYHWSDVGNPPQFTTYPGR